MASTHPRLGIVLVLAASMLWGTTGTAQALSGGGLTPLWFGALRLAVAAAFFFVYARATVVPASPSVIPAQAGIQRLPLGALIAAGLCMAVYNLAFFAGIRHTGVALGTAVAIGSGPVWAGILQALIARQLPGGLWWSGTGLAIAGGTLMSLSGMASIADISTAGIVLCLLSGLSYAGYTMIGKRIAHDVPAATVTLHAFAVAAAVAAPAAWLDAGLPSLNARSLAAVLYVGVITAGISYLLFAHALRHISAATAVTLALGEPVMAFTLAVTVLQETPSLQSLVGLLLVVGGVLVVVRAELATSSGSRP